MLKTITILLLILLSCDNSNESEENYSNNNWTFTTPANLGINQLAIDTAVSLISSGYLPNINAVLLVKDGQIFSEYYFNGRNATTQLPMYSAGKSKASIIVGIAYDQGLIDSVEAKIWTYFPQYDSINNWSPRKDSITIKNMLTMTMGLDCGNPNDANQPCNLGRFSHPDPIKSVLDLPMAASPGTVFLYHDASPHIAETMVSGLAGMPIEVFESTFLYEKLNIQNRNENGTNALKARDMAQIGQMMISNGQWNGNQILSPEWIEKSTAVSVPLVGKYITFRGDTVPFTDGYGYYWWHKTYSINGMDYPTFFAAGNGGQYIFCFPELNFVAVFSGSDLYSNASNYALDLLELYILPAIVN